MLIHESWDVADQVQPLGAVTDTDAAPPPTAIGWSVAETP